MVLFCCDSIFEWNKDGDDKVIAYVLICAIATGYLLLTIIF